MHKISRISLAFTGAILSASLLAACGEDNPTNAFDKFMSSSSTTQSDPLSSGTPPVLQTTIKTLQVLPRPHLAPQ